MTKLAEQLLEQAKALSNDERIELGEALISESLPDHELKYAPEWEAEIARRLESIERGETKLIPWEEARKQIFGELHE